MIRCVAGKVPVRGQRWGWDAEVDSGMPSPKVPQSWEIQLFKLTWDPPAALCRKWVQMNYCCEQIRIGGNKRDS